MTKQELELLNAIGETIVEFLISSAIAQNPTLLGSNLIKNISYQVQAGTVVINIPDYAKYVEYGLPAGTNKGVWVPIQKLIEWIKKKGIQPKTSVNQFAYAVQRKIFNVGINGVKARPFISEALKKSEEEVESLLAIQLENIIDIELKKML